MLRIDPVAIGNEPEFLADFHSLMEELVSAEGIETPHFVTFAVSNKVRDITSLRRFLEEVRSQILFPIELPSIVHAYRHATGNRVRELIQLDQWLGHQPINPEFIHASRRIGYYQLQRLRPLHDQRIVQRYLRAVEKGEAQGRHTLVYGIILHVYSLPLRQGLIHYSRKTLSTLIQNAAGPLGLTFEPQKALLVELMAPLQSVLDTLVMDAPDPGLKSV